MVTSSDTVGTFIKQTADTKVVSSFHGCQPHIWLTGAFNADSDVQAQKSTLWIEVIERYGTTMTGILANLRSFLNDSSIKNRAFRSSGFTIFKIGAQNFLRLASNLILTRLLFPEAFGIMALAQVVLAGTAMFSDLGIRASIVQNKRGDDPAFLNTAWTLQIIRGILLGVVVLFSASHIAAFYETPILADILRVLAIVPIVQGFASTRLATASRHLFIGRMVCLHVGAQLAGIIVMIVLAWWLESVWSLVIGSLVAPVIVTALSHAILPGVPNKLAFDRDAINSLIGFGKFIFLATIAGFCSKQGDKIILGKFIALSDLAIYNIAFFLAFVPMLIASSLNTSVMFPLYSRRPPSDSEGNRQKINRARFLITGFIFFGLFVLAMFGEQIVQMLYDPRYHAAGALITLIAIVALPRAIMVTYTGLMLAAGHSGRYAAIIALGAALEFGLMLVAGFNFGLIGVILAPLFAVLIYYPALVVVTRPYKGWDPKHDLIFFILATLITLLSLYYNQANLAQLFQHSLNTLKT